VSALTRVHYTVQYSALPGPQTGPESAAEAASWHTLGRFNADLSPRSAVVGAAMRLLGQTPKSDVPGAGQPVQRVRVFRDTAGTLGKLVYSGSVAPTVDQPSEEDLQRALDHFGISRAEWAHMLTGHSNLRLHPCATCERPLAPAESDLCPSCGAFGEGPHEAERAMRAAEAQSSALRRGEA
jgi:hypothetical protein